MRQSSFEQDVILAIAITVVGVIPALNDTPMIHVGHRLDVGVDPQINALELVPILRREQDVTRH